MDVPIKLVKKVYFINQAPILFDILYKLTNGPETVTKWRTDTLLSLRDKFGKIHNLENLLRRCRDIKPELVRQVCVYFRANIFQWSKKNDANSITLNILELLGKCLNPS